MAAGAPQLVIMASAENNRSKQNLLNRLGMLENCLMGSM